MAIGLCMAALTFAIAKQEMDNASDGELLTAANVLYALMQDELTEQVANTKGESIEVGDDLLSAEDARAFHASADWRMFAVFVNGRLLVRSDTGPTAGLIPMTAGFHDFAGPRGKWRSYGLVVPQHHMLLVVGERLHARHVVLRHVAASLALPMVALLPASAFLLWLSLGSGLAALRRLSGQLAERSLQDLERFSPAEWPTDLEMLILALNRLFERVDNAFEREQAFTDTAAHQLRTPLAAIKLQAQMIAAKAAEPLRAQIADLLVGIDRAATLVDQMLTLARLAATARLRVPVDLRTEVTQAIAAHALVAAQREVEFSLEGSTVSIASDPVVIGLVLSNLLENAVKNAPAGSLVDVGIAAQASSVTLTIADRGAGIPEEERAEVLRRFARGQGTGEGSGLGLAIVSRALDVLGGSLTLADRDDGTGLLAQVTLPR